MPVVLLNRLKQNRHRKLSGTPLYHPAASVDENFDSCCYDVGIISQTQFLKVRILNICANSLSV